MLHSLSFMIKCDGKSFANPHIAQSLFFLRRVFAPFHWNVNGSLEFQPIRAKTFAPKFVRKAPLLAEVTFSV